VPAVGATAHIRHFSGEAEPVRIVELREDGRCVVVEDSKGARREFTLRRANARFIERDEQHSPRLEF